MSAAADLPPADGQRTPFSVLLPVYHGDRSAFVRRAFESVTVDQQLRPDEVVLVQDGPVGPELAALVAELVADPAVPVRLVVLPVNVGLAGALEAGLAACAHEVVARADADDVSLPERFARQVPMVADGLDLVGSQITEFVDREDDLGLPRPVPVGAGAIAERARLHQPFHHPSVVYRRSVVAAAGGYQHLERMEDYWLFARMIAAGAKVDNVPDTLVLYRVGAGAYGRRGGLAMARSELALQRRLRRIGFTTRTQWLRNVLIRAGYRLLPEVVRKPAYRSFTRR